MGMYTCLKVHCILKSKYVSVIERLYKIEEELIKNPKVPKVGSTYIFEEHFNPWKILFIEFISKIDLLFISKWYYQKERTHNIPFGDGIDYYLESWDWLGLRGKEWKFIVEMKNYSQEFQGFINNVLPILAKEIKHCEFYYEGCKESKLYFNVDDIEYSFDSENEFYTGFYSNSELKDIEGKEPESWTEKEKKNKKDII